MVLDELAVRRTSLKRGVPVPDSPDDLRWISTEAATVYKWPNVVCPCCGSAPLHGFNVVQGGDVIGVCSLDACPVISWCPQIDTPSWWAGKRALGELR